MDQDISLHEILSLLSWVFKCPFIYGMIKTVDDGIVFNVLTRERKKGEEGKKEAGEEEREKLSAPYSFIYFNSKYILTR